MRLVGKSTAFSAVVLATLAAATLAQTPRSRKPSPPRSAESDTLVIGGTIAWIAKSEVAALRPGVLESIEVSDGTPVAKGRPFAHMHSETAELTRDKARIAANNQGAVMKAQAQLKLAIADRARQERIMRSNRSYVSDSEIQKADAEVSVAEAMVKDAQEQQAVAAAELKLAEQAVKEHDLTAPFDGVVVKRHKHPGESVQANEPVIQLGQNDRVRFFGFIPLSERDRVREGMIVDVRPTVNDGELPLENKRFRGKIVSLGSEVQAVLKTEVPIYAEIFNNKARELSPGLTADMIIYLDENAIPPPPGDTLQPKADSARASRIEPRATR